jgi:hypothetical protein
MEAKPGGPGTGAVLVIVIAGLLLTVFVICGCALFGFRYVFPGGPFS